MRGRSSSWIRGTLVVFAASLAAAAAAVSAAPAELHICHAGSVQAAFTAVEQLFSREHPETTVKDVSGGSVALAARMASGLQPCDVFAAADYLDIDLLLKPAGLADYTIVFARGRMVLAYLATDPRTRGVAGTGVFEPPRSVPPAAPEWYRALLQPGVRIAGSHPFLDPAGYRSHMMMELAERHYKVPNLANLLLEHYTILPAVAGPDTVPRPGLGNAYSFQFIYEHAAAAAATRDPSYRYVRLPDEIDLSNSDRDPRYAAASVTLPGLDPERRAVMIPAARVAWGLTIPRNSRNVEGALAFVGSLLGPPGAAALMASGPPPIAPALVASGDASHLPAALRLLVRIGELRP